jgi:hypothetical protein
MSHQFVWSVQSLGMSVFFQVRLSFLLSLLRDSRVYSPNQNKPSDNACTRTEQKTQLCKAALYPARTRVICSSSSTASTASMASRVCCLVSCTLAEGAGDDGARLSSLSAADDLASGETCGLAMAALSPAATWAGSFSFSSFRWSSRGVALSRASKGGRLLTWHDGRWERSFPGVRPWEPLYMRRYVSDGSKS